MLFDERRWHLRRDAPFERDGHRFPTEAEERQGHSVRNGVDGWRELTDQGKAFIAVHVGRELADRFVHEVSERCIRGELRQPHYPVPLRGSLDD